MKNLVKKIFFLFTLYIIPHPDNAQSFLNGSFEINTSGIDRLGLSNAAFNGYMSNTVAYGSAGNMDIIGDTVYCGLAEDSTWFVALTGGGTDAITMQLSSPLLVGATYEITFWDRSCFVTSQPIQLGVSTVSGATGTVIYAGSVTPDTVWTQRTVSFIAPAGGAYISILLPTGTVADWAQIDNFSLSIPSNSIITKAISGSPFCACSNLNVPFISVGTFAPGNIYTAQLSDASGSFTTPVTIGTLTTTDSVDSIACTIPCSSITGTGYRIRVVSSDTAIIGTDNGIDISINAPPIATFSYPGTPFCQDEGNQSPVFTGGGTAGTFTSAGGISIDALTGIVNLTASTAGGYIVTNTIAASGGCAAVSDTGAITINALPTVTVNSPVICTGQTDTLTAAGADSYTWSAGATSTGTNTATVTPVATTTYTVTGTTLAGCISTSVATVTVTTCAVPTANFSASIITICKSGCVDFSDLSIGSPTSWTWLFPGAATTTSSLQNPTNICYTSTGNYSVTLIVTNANGSDTLTKTDYITVVDPTVTITGNLDINVCENTALSATPTNGTYVWGPSYGVDCSTCPTIIATPDSTQVYYVIYTSPEGCIATDTVTVSMTKIYNYFMPTGFSPNGDGINDSIIVMGKGIDFINLKIFDRIGEKVFETTDILSGWDGNLHGLPMNDNVFVYILEVTYCNRETVKEQGTITLVK